jgi:hypothetical protein
LGVPSCREAIYTSCPTNICLENRQTPPPTSITCPKPGSPCKLNDGRVVESGYIEYCNTPLCGTWDENQCEALHCLLDREEDAKKTCGGHDGSYCKNNKGTLTPKGQTESCGLQACSPLKTLNACPTTINNCYDPTPIKELKCEGPRCKINEKLFAKGEHFTKPCLSRPCGTLTVKKSDQNPPKCIPKNGHMYNDQPRITHTCVGGVGCKDEKGNFYETNKSITTVSSLPGCPYWGEWYDVGECKLEKDNKAIQSQKRDCFRRQSNGVPVSVAEGLCLADKNLGLPTQEIPCNYQWGKWEKIKKCPDNCVNDNQKSQIYATCDGGNNKAFCKHETSNKIYSDAESITCGDVKPKCGTWGEWSACEFDGNDGYGSCNKKDAIKTRECSGSYCKDPEGITGNKKDTLACYADKCQINIDNNNIDKQIIIDWLVEDVNVPLRPSNKDIRVVISKNSYFSAPSSNACAIQSLGYFKKLTIINNGIITGYSGKGGAGAKPASDPDRYFSEPSEEILKELNGENGENGGNAICIGQDNKDVNIVNNGIIKGGRAGGGGGAGTCYDIKKDFGISMISIEENCLNGGDGGDGSDPYLQTIMKGKDGQKRIEATFVIESGTGGDGGVLFKESTLQVDEIPREALRGKEGDLIRLRGYNSDIEIITGNGGGRGVNGSPCWVNKEHSDCDLP